MSPTGRNRAEGGYTLLELIVVLSVISLMALTIPTLAQGIWPGYRLKAAAAQIEADLQEEKHISATGGVPSGLKTVLAANTYFLVGSKQEKNLDEGFEITLAPHPDFANQGATEFPAILFYPNGQSTGGAIQIKYEGREAVLVVDWLTGRVTEADDE